MNKSPDFADNQYFNMVSPTAAFAQKKNFFSPGGGGSNKFQSMKNSPYKEQEGDKFTLNSKNLQKMELKA